MKQVIIFQRGQLKPADKSLLRKADYIPIEVDDPRQVTILLPTAAELKGDAITTAALKAIMGNCSGNERQRFAEFLIKSILPPQ